MPNRFLSEPVGRVLLVFYVQDSVFTFWLASLLGKIKEVFSYISYWDHEGRNKARPSLVGRYCWPESLYEDKRQNFHSVALPLLHSALS